MKATRSSKAMRIVATGALAAATLGIVGCSGGGGGEALVESKCVPCHMDIDSYTNRYTTLEDWQACMERMQGYTDTISDEDAATLADYLAELNGSGGAASSDDEAAAADAATDGAADAAADEDASSES